MYDEEGMGVGEGVMKALRKSGEGDTVSLQCTEMQTLLARMAMPSTHFSDIIRFRDI